METVRFNKIYCPPSSFGLIKLTEHGRRWKLNNGTGTDQIATEAEAASKGGSSSSSNKCCTKSRAVALNCSVSGNYSDNQLVKYSNLSKKITRYKATFIANNGDFMASYILCTGVPNPSNYTRYRLSQGTDEYTFIEFQPIYINQPSGGNMAALNINNTGYIYAVKSSNQFIRIKSFTHKNEDYTISWNQ